MSLRDVLVNEHSLDLTGWTLRAAWDISADGHVIVGSGVNPSGQTEAWLAVIPEPSSALSLLVIGTAATLRRWRHASPRLRALGMASDPAGNIYAAPRTPTAGSGELAPSAVYQVRLV